MAAVSVKILESSLDYDPDTGIFTRKQTNSFNPKAKSGKPAGHLNRDGYVYIRIGKHRHLAHRLAWFFSYGYWPVEIDHVNQNRSDNRIANLRKATRIQNMANTAIPKHNSSGVKGISFDKTNNKWYVYISFNNRMKNLGRFENFANAVDVRKAAERKYFGEFIRAF